MNFRFEKEPRPGNHELYVDRKMFMLTNLGVFSASAVSSLCEDGTAKAGGYHSMFYNETFSTCHLLLYV